jgi:hypothetical protein
VLFCYPDTLDVNMILREQIKSMSMLTCFISLCTVISLMLIKS